MTNTAKAHGNQFISTYRLYKERRVMDGAECWWATTEVKPEATGAIEYMGERGFYLLGPGGVDGVVWSDETEKKEARKDR